MCCKEGRKEGRRKGGREDRKEGRKTLASLGALAREVVLESWRLLARW
jgi:hypothetical protein